MQTRLFLLFIINFALLFGSSSRAFADSQPSFYPMWRMLNSDQKVNFVAGYINGWKDAAKVTDIAIGYVRENPQGAVAGLEKLKQLYSVEGVVPENIVAGINKYYSKSENQNASFSQALTAVKDG